jgi:hypothetical protein
VALVAQKRARAPLSMFSTTVPCGLWQFMQSSLTGSWLCTNGPRFSMWQA